MNNNKIEEQFLLAIRLHAQWEEVWLPVRGLPNYEVSSEGKVRNLNTKKILRSSNHNKGYRKVVLFKNGKDSTMLLHRIVCATFYPNPHNKRFVDHIDNDKSNNNLSNLRWCTASENNMNKSISSRNKSGIIGVHLDSTGKWRAQIKLNGIKKYLGSFNTIRAAQKSRLNAEKLMFGSFANDQATK
eukprot:gene11494-12869_t